jgi:hypothetical protein
VTKHTKNLFVANILVIFFFFFFGGTGVWTQGFMLAVNLSLDNPLMLHNPDALF